MFVDCPTMHKLLCLWSTLVILILLTTSLRERQYKKYTHNFTYSFAKYRKNIFGRNLLLLNPVKTRLVDIRNKLYNIMVDLLIKS